MSTITVLDTSYGGAAISLVG